MADRVEQQLGNYQLVALLGQGSYADVYLGQHVRLPLHVALKVRRTHLTAQEAEHFQQEAETIARLAHPSIVRILDYDVQEGVPFLVMDYAPHGSLRRRYPKGTVVPLPEIVSCVKQIAAALHYAHEQKVRDCTIVCGSSPRSNEAPWKTGAALPYVVSSGTKTFLLHLANEHHPTYDGLYVTEMRTTDSHRIVLVEFIGAYAFQFGGLNDEAISRHRL